MTPGRPNRSPRRAARAGRRAPVLTAVAIGLVPAGVVVLLAACFAVPDRGDAAVEPDSGAARTAIAAVPAPGADPATAPATDLVDDGWADAVSAATGIPRRALVAYAAADLTLADEQPACTIGWTTLAGIGWVESHHGAYGGAVLGDDGVVSPGILGPRLNGDSVAAIPDTDGGRLDGDGQWDRAMGPLQFIPETWRRWGSDGNLDGVRDPHHIDDAALAAARYLCRSGPLDSEQAWRDAVFTYNPLTRYVDDVAIRANEYRQRAER